MKQINLKYFIKAINNSKVLLPLLSMVILFSLFISCEPWDETAEVSHVSHLPRFEIIGGDFNSFVVSSDSTEYEDPGAIAYENNAEIRVYAYGTADLTKVGVYPIFYYAENSDGLYAVGERVVAVTYKDVSENDLSGKYTGTLWEPLTEMRVDKVDDKGLYKCTEVFGYPGAEMKGRFVDLGNNELILVHGEGDFGRYASTEGYYTKSSLTWVVSLQDEPYYGIDITVNWIKQDE